MKNRRPRKLKKHIKKNGILIYDIALLPRHITIDRLHKNFIHNGLVLYNSQGAGNLGGVNSNNTPQIINNINKIKLIDLSQKSD